MFLNTCHGIDKEVNHCEGDIGYGYFPMDK